jgi:hypothetical protein
MPKFIDSYANIWYVEVSLREVENSLFLIS